MPILMLTRSEEDMVDALRCGADDYVRTPHEPAELTARVGAVLRAHQVLLRAERAEQSVRSLLTQLPDVAHDLRSPLNAMNMRTHLLLDGARGPLSDEVRLELQKVIDRIGGLVVVIDDLLALAHLEAKAILGESEDPDT